MLASLGFIYEPFTSKAELPIVIIRLRENIQKISQSKTFLILKSELERCFDKYGTLDNKIIHEYYKQAMLKVASSKYRSTGALRVKRVK